MSIDDKIDDYERLVIIARRVRERLSHIYDSRIPAQVMMWIKDSVQELNEVLGDN